MRNDGKSVKQSPLLQRGSVKYAPVKQNRSTNPFDTSNNPFDDDVEVGNLFVLTLNFDDLIS